jgi:hypothetical protein
MCRFCKDPINPRPHIGRKKQAPLRRRYSKDELRILREPILERVGFAIEQMIKGTGTSRRQLSQAVGRDMGWRFVGLLSNGDFKISTLLDLAHVVDHDVTITLTPKTSKLRKVA